MKHFDAPMIKALKEKLASINIQSSDNQCELLLKHLDLVIEKNKVLNLTRIIDPMQAINLHIIDSLQMLPEFNAATPGNYCDLGTGAGFPGISLAIMTDRDGILVDSVQKKIKAVQEFTSVLGLNSRIKTSFARAEELAITESGKYAVVTARALTSLPSLIELASPLLKNGGDLIALKARPDSNELESGKNVAALCGMTLVSVRDIDFSEEFKRKIIVYRKTEKSSVILPRRTGLAQKKPLA